MIIRNILTAGLMLVWTGIAHAADMLTVQDVQVAPNKSVTLAVCLDNETTNLMGWQCDIVLPEGLTLVLKENGKPDATLGDRFATTGHIISSSRLANGTYRFIGMSMDGETIPGNSGTLFMVTLMADASLAERAGTGPALTLTGMVKNIEFNTQDNQKLIMDNVAFGIILLDEAPTVDDSLTVKDMEMAPGKSAIMAVDLSNSTTNLMGWQCDIVLPEGLTLALNVNGRPNATLGNRFATTEHKISSSVLANNTYRFIGMSMEGEAIPDNSGTLFMVTLMADASLAEQAGMWPAPTLLGIIKKIEFNTQDNQKITFSDVSFNVNIINHPQVIYDLKQGWNWISTSATTEASSFLEPIKDKTQRLVSQTQELINDAEYGLVGGLQTMEVTAGYKLKMEEEATAYLTGNFADPSATQVQLYKGWNWIGYVPMVALPVETALENLQATAGDQLVCKDEFAEYDGSAWVPADIVMEPGKGYMYKSAKNVTFKYSSATSAPAASNQRVQVSSFRSQVSSVRSQVSSDQQSPWQYDVYRYPDNMTIVAQVADVEEQVTVGAFCGDECRGIGRWVNDKLFIGVQGSAGSDEVISFRCYDSTTDDIVPVAETILFDGDSHGSLAAPIRLTLQGIATGIDANSVSGTFDVYSTNGLLVRRNVTSLRGLAPGVYLVRGRKVVVR